MEWIVAGVLYALGLAQWLTARRGFTSPRADPLGFIGELIVALIWPIVMVIILVVLACEALRK